MMSMKHEGIWTQSTPVSACKSAFRTCDRLPHVCRGELSTQSFCCAGLLEHFIFKLEIEGISLTRSMAAESCHSPFGSKPNISPMVLNSRSCGHERTALPLLHHSGQFDQKTCLSWAFDNWGIEEVHEWLHAHSLRNVLRLWVAAHTATNQFVCGYVAACCSSSSIFQNLREMLTTLFEKTS